MKPRTCLRVLSSMFLSVVAACGGGSGGDGEGEATPPPVDAASFSPVRVLAALPPGVDTRGWKANAGTLSTSPLRADGSSEVGVFPEEHQLLWIGDAQDRLVLSAVREPGQEAVVVEPWTTAISMVAVDPFLLSDYLADPAEFRDVAATLPEVGELARLIERKLGGLAADMEIHQAMESARDAFIRKTHPEEAAADSFQKVTLSVLGTTSGLTVEKLEVRANVLKLKITNRMSRWVTAYVEDGDQLLAEALVPPASFFKLIPFQLRKPSVTLAEPGYDIVAHPNARLRLYGPGGLVPEDWSVEKHPERLLRPTVATVIDYFVHPVLLIVTGIGSILRAHGPDSVKRKLWTEVMAYFSGKVETGEWHRIAAGIVHRGIQALLANDAELLRKACAEAGTVVGAELALKILAPGVYPAYNLSQMASSMVNVVKARIDYAKAFLRVDVGIRSVPPEIWANASTTFGAAPLIVRFDVGSSRLIRRYEWNFGDGSAPEARESWAGATHVYSANGRYKVVLKITDTDGATASKEFDIEVGMLQAPTGLTAKAHALGWIRLAWNYAGDRPVSFKVLRSADGQTYSAVGGGFGTTFDDRALPSGSRYTYVVQAAYQGVTSAFTDAASAKTWSFLELPADATWTNARVVSGRTELIPGSPWVWAIQPDEEYGSAVIGTTFDLPSNAAIKGVSILGSFPSYHRVWINGKVTATNAPDGVSLAGYPWIAGWWTHPVVPGRNTIQIGAAHPDLWSDTQWRSKPYGSPAFTVKIGIVYETP